MIPTRIALLSVAIGGLMAGSAMAQRSHVVESVPTANAAINTRSTGFTVRFDRPVDHVRSLLIIKRDGKVVATLHPRFQTAPDVLFAQAPPLAPGDYALVWQIKSLSDADIAEGEIPFRVVASP